MQLIAPQDVGAEIRARRVRQGLTQGELAARAGVSRQWLIRLEAGHPGAELGRLMFVVQALGLVLAFGERRPEVPGEVDLDQLFQDRNGA